MRRADRLFQIVQLIRGRRLRTAAYVAERLGTSIRTIYRDVADLQHQVVTIEGDAGVGYRLGAGFDLPPLMFIEAEAKALVATARVAQIGLDDSLAHEAEAARGIILSVLATAARAAAESQALYAPRNVMMGLTKATRAQLQLLREAVEAQRKIELIYQDLSAKPSQARCARWVAFTGAKCGRWQHGAKHAKTFAIFGSIAFKAARCWRLGSNTRWIKR